MGIGGTIDGKFFHILPGYVDKTKPPGSTPMPTPTLKAYLHSLFTLRMIWESPNLVWLLMALTVYYAFPYDLGPRSIAATKGAMSIEFFASRFPLWYAIVMGYFAFAHVSLYWAGWADRPFIPNRRYRWSKVLHNVFYSSIGVAVWVAFENVFCFLWATGRLPYLRDQDAFQTPEAIARYVFGILLVPALRDAHFYFAHRLIHYRPLFQCVHALHHRNTDIEPFAGLCMHPIEHLYYYTSIFPSLVMLLSPLSFLWNGLHLLLAPAFSHSGYEDHWQADAFHYYHHRYFEVNYAGFSAGFLDAWFGSYWGNGWKEKPPISTRDDSKATLDVSKGFTLDSLVSPYGLLSSAMLLLFAYAANNSWIVSQFGASHIAFWTGFGPVVAAMLVTGVRDGSLKGAFPATGGTLLHLALGTVITALPIAGAAFLALS